MESRRVFDLRGVGHDEANEVRELLDVHGIHYYETPAASYRGNPALWVTDDEDYTRARRLIDQYQFEHAQRARAEFAPKLRRLRMYGHLPTRLYDGLTAILRERRPVLLFLAVLGVFTAIALIWTAPH